MCECMHGNNLPKREPSVAKTHKEAQERDSVMNNLISQAPFHAHRRHAPRVQGRIVAGVARWIFREIGAFRPQLWRHGM